MCHIVLPGTATIREQTIFSTCALKSAPFLAGALLLVSVAASLHAATTILIATEVGPVKSTDGGATWSVIPVNVNGGLLSGQPFTHTVAVDPKTPSTWYAGGPASSTFGFYKSTDSGHTWTGTPFLTFQPFFQPGSIVFDPVTTSTIYLMDRVA